MHFLAQNVLLKTALVNGDGLDEVHIGDGISEGTQVDMVPNYIKLSQEKIPINAPEVEGIELKDRTIIVQPKVRKVLFNMLDGFKKQTSNATAMPKKPVELPVADIKTAKKKLKTLIKENFEGELMILNLLEFISNLDETLTPSCYIDLLYDMIKNTPIVGIFRVIQEYSWRP